MEHRGKAAIFIEGPFVHFGLCENFPNQNLTIDYEKFVKYIEERFGIYIHTKTMYMPDPEYGSNAGASMFRNKLSYLGFCVKLKPPSFVKDKSGKDIMKCNFDSQISVEMFELATLGKVDYIILLASDIDYAYILERVHNLGIHTIVFGFRNTMAGIKNISDTYICFNDIVKDVMMQKTGVEKKNGEKNGVL